MEERPKSYEMYINGEFVPAESGNKTASVCPGDAEVLAEFPEGNSEDVEKAVAAAKLAFESTDWGNARNSLNRGQLLREISKKMREKVDYLAELESLDAGKTITETNLVDVHYAADCFEYFADLATHIEGSVLPVPMDVLDFTLREPIGVCGSVVAWNFPLMFVAWKVAPALAAGNTVVLKPAELTSLSALEMAKIFHEANVPPGVVNIVTGAGRTVGEAIAGHKDVGKISFTGSTKVGSRILALAGSNCKKVTLELGGKSPNIVFDDADLDKAVSGALSGIFFNAGQCCIAGSRVFIQESLYDEFVDQLVRRTKQIKVGHPLDWEARMGAIITPQQKKRILEYIASGKKEGAELLCGGTEPDPLPHPKGNYILPTVFAAKDDSLTICREEIFGPVLTVFKFKDEEEVISRANDTPYGLASAVWTKDIKRAFRVSKQLKAGQVWINNYLILSPFAPHGGYKESGFGKDLSKYALEEYTQIKNVFVDLSEGEFLTLYD
ncbi:MAG: aldehyde dehydrogenase family protein [bacterium]